MNRKTLTVYSTRLLAMLLLITCLLAAIPVTLSAWAEEGQTDAGGEGENAQTCSLKIYPVDPEKEDYAKDLRQAGVVIDIYRIADAKPQTRYDAYDYSLVGEFSTLKLDTAMDHEKWSALARQAAEIVEEKSVEHRTAEAAEGISNIRAEGLSDGIYLLIARGRSAVEKKEYLDHRPPTEEELKKDPKAKGEIFSYVDSKEFTYQFTPQLVALPGKADMKSADQTISSFDSGAWLRDLTVYLKPQREDRKLDLKIVKTLTEFVGPEPATFVFKITATKEVEGKEQIVFSREIAKTFSAEGDQEEILEKVIPVGAKVTVTEEYDGASYVLFDSTEMPLIASADTPLEAKFVNKPDTFRGGQGVVNNFKLDPSGDWPWRQVKDEADLKD